MTEISYEIAKEQAVGAETVGVDFAPADMSRPFWVWSGVGYHTHAARVSAAELLRSWPEHLDLVSAWLEPILVQLADGTSLNPDDVLAAYSAYHGKAAPRSNTAGG